MPVRDEKVIYGKKGARAPSYAGGQTSWLTRFMLLIIVIALGGVAFWGIQLQNQLHESRATLADYDHVIAQLRKQLSVTDESINQSSAQADDRLKELDAEIRKLWDNVWKRSRQRLDRNEANLKALQNQQAAFLKTVDEQTQVLATLDANIKAMVERFPAVEATANEAQKATGSLVASIESLRAELKSLNSQQLVLAAQANDTEDWIQSINGYRKLVNRRLDELQTELTQVSKTKAQAAPAPAPIQ